MNWVLLSLVALGAGVVMHRINPWLVENLGRAAVGTAAAIRRTTDLDRMIAALHDEEDPLGRHRLLTGIVEASHRQRDSAAMNKVFMRFAELHVNELPGMAPALTAAGAGKLPRVPAFKLLAMALEREKRFAEAAKVCAQALDLGLEDGTKTGFRGRLKRLQRKI